eukprot:scaffold3964_cov336-Prasinococcus_capsulatus_cf.AAC.8
MSSVAKNAASGTEAATTPVEDVRLRSLCCTEDAPCTRLSRRAGVALARSIWPDAGGELGLVASLSLAQRADNGADEPVELPSADAHALQAPLHSGPLCPASHEYTAAAAAAAAAMPGVEAQQSISSGPSSEDDASAATPLPSPPPHARAAPAAARPGLARISSSICSCCCRVRWIDSLFD